MKRVSSGEIFEQTFGAKIDTFESFKRAIDGLGETTIGHYKQVLPAYFLYLGQNPDEVIAQRKLDIISKDFEENEHYERKTRAYIKKKVEAGLDVHSDISRIMGFFCNNAKKFALDIDNKKMKIPKSRKKNKFSPSISEVRKLYEVGDNRGKLIVAIMSQHGASPMDVSKMKIGTYPKNAWEYFEYSRHKTGEIWRGVSTPDVCELMRVYLETRGGKEGEPLFVGRVGVLDNGGVSDVVADLIKKAGFDDIKGFVPICLRDFTEDALTYPDINVKDKETLMGRTADVQHVYGGEKRMKERLIEAMQSTYQRIKLTNYVIVASQDGYSAEDKAFVDRVLANRAKLEESMARSDKIIEMYEKGVLVHIDDIAAKLAEKGLIVMQAPTAQQGGA